MTKLNSVVYKIDLISFINNPFTTKQPNYFTQLIFYN